MKQGPHADKEARHARVIALLIQTLDVHRVAESTGYAVGTVRTIASLSGLSLRRLRAERQPHDPPPPSRGHGQRPRRFRLEDVIAAYERHQSLRKAGRELGLSPQGVKNYLDSPGYVRNPAPKSYPVCPICSGPIRTYGRVTCSPACRSEQMRRRSCKVSDAEMIDLFRRLRPSEVIRLTGLRSSSVYNRRARLRKRGLL